METEEPKPFCKHCKDTGEIEVVATSETFKVSCWHCPKGEQVAREKLLESGRGR